MNRSVVVYSVLLAAALIASYLSWTSEAETESAAAVTVASFAPEELETITWETDEKRLVLQVREDDRGRHVWVDATDKARQSKPKSDSPAEREREKPTSGADGRAGADAGTEAPDAVGDPDAGNGDTGPESTPPQRRERDRAGEGDSDESERTKESYLASSAVEDLFENLNPLRARRRLTVEGEEREKMYGFDEPRGSLTLTLAGGETRTFTVGGYTYGRRHLYVRDDGDESYYVVDAGVISPLRFAETRLKQKRAVEIEQRKIGHVLVESGGDSTKLVQHNPDDPSAAYWSIAETEDEKSRTADSWIGKLLRLQIDRYVTGERPSGLESVGVVHVHPQSGPKTTLKLYERSAEHGTEYYAESEFTRKLVELRRSSASTLVADIETLLEGGAPPKEEDEASSTPGSQPSKPKMERRRPPKGGAPPKGHPPTGDRPGRGTGRPPGPAGGTRKESGGSGTR